MPGLFRQRAKTGAVRAGTDAVAWIHDDEALGKERKAKQSERFDAV